MLDTEPLIHADPARELEPPRERSRARLDALLAAEPDAPRQRRPRRRGALVAAGAAALAALAVAVATSLPGSPSPAQAFAKRLQGDGIVHIAMAHERTHDASGDGVNPRQDELWISLADGRWRLRTHIEGWYTDQAFDGRTLTLYDSRTGTTTTDTPSDPSLLKRGPLLGPSVAPLTDPRMKLAGEATIGGETVYDLVPTRPLPEDLQVHWYVTKDGELRRMAESATVGGAPTSLTTDVDAYEVLPATAANEALLRR